MVYPSSMTAPARSTKPNPSQAARAERLAAALRENLKRRKAQERIQQQVQERSKKPTAGKD